MSRFQIYQPVPRSTLGDPCDPRDDDADVDACYAQLAAKGEELTVETKQAIENAFGTGGTVTIPENTTPETGGSESVVVEPPKNFLFLAPYVVPLITTVAWGTFFNPVMRVHQLACWIVEGNSLCCPPGFSPIPGFDDPTGLVGKASKCVRDASAPAPPAFEPPVTPAGCPPGYQESGGACRAEACPKGTASDGKSCVPVKTGVPVKNGAVVTPVGVTKGSPSNPTTPPKKPLPGAINWPVVAAVVGVVAVGGVIVYSSMKSGKKRK